MRGCRTVVIACQMAGAPGIFRRLNADLVSESVDGLWGRPWNFVVRRCDYLYAS